MKITKQQQETFKENSIQKHVLFAQAKIYFFQMNS